MSRDTRLGVTEKTASATAFVRPKSAPSRTGLI